MFDFDKNYQFQSWRKMKLLASSISISIRWIDTNKHIIARALTENMLTNTWHWFDSVSQFKTKWLWGIEMKKKSPILLYFLSSFLVIFIGYAVLKKNHPHHLLDSNSHVCFACLFFFSSTSTLIYGLHVVAYIGRSLAHLLDSNLICVLRLKTLSIYHNHFALNLQLSKLFPEEFSLFISFLG